MYQGPARLVISTTHKGFTRRFEGFRVGLRNLEFRAWKGLGFTCPSFCGSLDHYQYLLKTTWNWVDIDIHNEHGLCASLNKYQCSFEAYLDLNPKP